MEQARITSPQGSQNTHVARGKTSAQGGDQGMGASAVGPGDFMSLLASMGDGSEVQFQDVSLETTEPAVVAADGAAMAAWQGGLLPWPLPEAGALMTAQIAARSVSLGNEGQMGSGVGAVADGLLGTGALPQDGLVAQTMLLDAAESRIHPADPAGTPGSLAAPPAGGGRRTVARAAVANGGQAIDLSAQAGAPVSGTKAAVAAQLVQATLAPQTAERREGGAAQRETGPSMAPEVTSTLMMQAPGLGESMPGGRSQAQGGEPGTQGPGVWAQTGEVQESQAAGVVEGFSGIADASMAATEDAVAEQVAFWVHQNIQNAELTVKHDGKPVEVSVSLSGNEAQVAFRSDQAQTRDLLEASVAQLREMLRQEGLELSGVSVGESGSQAGGSGPQQGHQGNPRNAQVVVPAGGAGVSSRGAGVNILTDRAVDIFV